MDLEKELKKIIKEGYTFDVDVFGEDNSRESQT